MTAVHLLLYRGFALSRSVLRVDGMFGLLSSEHVCSTCLSLAYRVIAFILITALPTGSCCTFCSPYAPLAGCEGRSWMNPHRPAKAAGPTIRSLGANVFRCRAHDSRRCANVPAGGTRGRLRPMQGRPCKLCMLHRFLGREGLRVWGLRVHSAGLLVCLPPSPLSLPSPPSSFPSVLVRSIYSCLSPSSFPCRRRSLLASLSLSASLSLYLSLFVCLPPFRRASPALQHSNSGGSFRAQGTKS